MKKRVIKKRIREWEDYAAGKRRRTPRKLPNDVLASKKWEAVTS